MWYRFQFNKINEAWVRVEILCLDLLKTWSDQYIKLREVATFENWEIFSKLNFSYIRDYKATLSGVNYSFFLFLKFIRTNTVVSEKRKTEKSYSLFYNMLFYKALSNDN